MGTVRVRFLIFFGRLLGKTLGNLIIITQYCTFHFHSSVAPVAWRASFTSARALSAPWRSLSSSRSNVATDGSSFVAFVSAAAKTLLYYKKCLCVCRATGAGLIELRVRAAKGRFRLQQICLSPRCLFGKFMRIILLKKMR